VALVEPEHLLIKVAVQVERPYAYIGTMQAALQEAPEVLHPASVDLAIGISYSMIDDLVLKVV
jgi:hypothetical protein